MTSLVVCICRHPEITRAEFSQHWRDVHGPMVRRCSDFARHLVSYDQYHLSDDRGELALFGAVGDFDGIAVLTFHDADAMDRDFREPQYLRAVQPDEPRFIDLERCISYVMERVSQIPVARTS